MTTIITNSKTDTKLEELKAILYLLQTNIDSIKDEVDTSYALLELGAKTKLSAKIEQTIDNPLKEFIDFSKNIDMNVNIILIKYTKGFFNKNKSLINRVFKTNANESDLHFSIVLKVDTIENRSVFFDFLDKLEGSGINQNKNILFQFIPKNLIDKVSFAEEINL